MNNDALTTTWSCFRELPIVEREWPRAAGLAALPFLADFAPDQAADLEADYESVRSFSILPIVAVAGGKNAGKSSLVSAFLAKTNRARIPRGFKSELGTHRFTLWLPLSWQNHPELLARNKKRLAEIFGHAAEPLSQDPLEAIRQQTQHHAIEIPLIAFDEALDEQGIALLDCPDIDSAPGNTTETNARLRMLTRAGCICAGVIFVTERAKIETNLLTVITQHLPQAALVYAINFVGDEQPHEVLEDLIRRLGRAPNYCYMAFTYREEGYASRTPRIDPILNEPQLPSLEKMPFYFEVLPAPEANLPDRVTPQRTISQLGKRLDPAALLQARQKELITDLQAKLRRTVAEIETRVTASGQAVDTAARRLFERCQDLFSDDGELVVQLDVETIRTIADSLERTAPWDIKILLWPYRNLLKSLQSGNLAKIKEWLARKRRGPQIPQSRITDQMLGQMLVEWSAGSGSTRSAETWNEDAREILQRYSVIERTTLSENEWDAAANALWKKTPKWRQRTLLVAGLVTGLLAIASAITALMGPHGIFILPIAKLLSTLGIAGGAAAIGDSSLEFRSLLKKLTLQQVSNFFAICADRVGVPREIPGDFADQVPVSRVPWQFHGDAYGIRDQQWQRANTIPKNIEDVAILDQSIRTMISPTLHACHRAAQDAEHHALQLGPDWSGSRPVLDSCAAFRKGCDMLAQNRGFAMVTIAFVGPKNAGKTTLVRLLINNEKVRSQLKVGVASAQATERPMWLAPKPPSEVQRGQEDYIPCHESELEPLGFPYAILDVPGLDEGETARSRSALQALDQAQIKVLAVERAKLGTANWQTYLAKTDGAAIVPVVTHTPPPDDPQDALSDYDLRKFEQLLQACLPTSTILPTLVMQDYRRAGADSEAILEDTRRGLRERLSRAARETSVELLVEPQLVARLRRFKEEIANLATQHLPATAQALSPMEGELRDLPITAVNDLLGNERTLTANTGAALRSLLLDRTPVLFFPWRLAISIANLVHGATDRLPLALLGSPLSIITTVSTVAKNLWHHHQFSKDVQTGLKRQLEARLKEQFSPRLVSLEHCLASDLQLGNRAGIHTREKSSIRVVGLEVLQAKSTDSFQSIMAEKCFSPQTAILLGLLGCFIFWSMLGQPLSALYLDFFHAADAVLIHRNATVHTFPSDTFSVLATSTLLAVLPMTLLLLSALAWLTRKSKTRACIEKLKQLHRKHISEMNANGELFTELTEPQLDACRSLLSFGSKP